MAGGRGSTHPTAGAGKREDSNGTQAEEAPGSPGGGPGDEPRRIFEELGRISLIDVVLPTRQKKVEIGRRRISGDTDVVLTHLPPQG